MRMREALLLTLMLVTRPPTAGMLGWERIIYPLGRGRFHGNSLQGSRKHGGRNVVTTMLTVVVLTKSVSLRIGWPCGAHCQQSKHGPTMSNGGLEYVFALKTSRLNADALLRAAHFLQDMVTCIKYTYTLQAAHCIFYHSNWYSAMFHLHIYTQIQLVHDLIKNWRNHAWHAQLLSAAIQSRMLRRISKSCCWRFARTTSLHESMGPRWLRHGR